MGRRLRLRYWRTGFLQVMAFIPAVLSGTPCSCLGKLPASTGAVPDGVPFSLGLPQRRAVAAPLALFWTDSTDTTTTKRQRGIYA